MKWYIQPHEKINTKEVLFIKNASNWKTTSCFDYFEQLYANWEQKKKKYIRLGNILTETWRSSRVFKQGFLVQFFSELF